MSPFAQFGPAETFWSKEEKALCLSCHDSTNAKFKTAHASYPVQTKSCMVCHDPHTSDQPKLLRASAHDPVVSGSCDMCHNEPSSDKAFGLKENTVSSLCAQCHMPDDLKAGGTIEHAPFKQGLCLQCHNPHSSQNPKLLRAGVNTLCLGCHTDKQQKGATVHAPVASGKDALPVICLMLPRTTIFTRQKRL